MDDDCQFAAGTGVCLDGHVDLLAELLQQAQDWVEYNLEQADCAKYADGDAQAQPWKAICELEDDSDDWFGWLPA